MSFFSVNARAPVIQQGVHSWHERLQVAGEQYTISIERGFDTAGFTLLGSEEYLFDWYMNGLVRDVTWRGPDGFLCWQGHVVRMAYSAGGFTRNRSIEPMATRVIYVVDALNTGTNPPKSQGQSRITKNDTSLQSLYGIKTVVLSGGEATAANADVAAETALNQLARVQLGETQAAQGPSPSLQVELAGYAYMLDWYIYSQTASSGTQDASTVIGSVIAADPNGIISSDTSLIETNTTATERYWDLQPAFKVIDTITKRGRVVSTVGEPWVSGIYEGRRLVYKPAEWVDSSGNPKSSNQRLRLYRQKSDAGSRYVDEGGNEIPYWHLRPDRLVYTLGLPGKEPLYVTKVSFAPPVGIQVAGLDLQSALKGVVKV